MFVGQQFGAQRVIGVVQVLLIRQSVGEMQIFECVFNEISRWCATNAVQHLVIVNVTVFRCRLNAEKRFFVNQNWSLWLWHEWIVRQIQVVLTVVNRWGRSKGAGCRRCGTGDSRWQSIQCRTVVADKFKLTFPVVIVEAVECFGFAGRYFCGNANRQWGHVFNAARVFNASITVRSRDDYHAVSMASRRSTVIFHRQYTSFCFSLYDERFFVSLSIERRIEQ